MSNKNRKRKAHDKDTNSRKLKKLTYFHGPSVFLPLKLLYSLYFKIFIEIDSFIEVLKNYKFLSGYLC